MCVSVCVCVGGGTKCISIPYEQQTDPAFRQSLYLSTPTLKTTADIHIVIYLFPSRDTRLSHIHQIEYVTLFCVNRLRPIRLNAGCQTPERRERRGMVEGGRQESEGRLCHGGVVLPAG